MKTRNKTELDNYYSRLREVLKVTGKLTLIDLQYCKALTEEHTKPLNIDGVVCSACSQPLPQGYIHTIEIK